MNGLTQLAFIGFSASGEITEIKQLSLGLKLEQVFIAAKGNVEAMLKSDSVSVRIVISEQRQVTFCSADKVEETLTRLMKKAGDA
ncbi:hypothetical protein F0267_01255 [Vibrio coralliilyticus]|uniref:Uncharacterized protein n=1 Tax=Vibrio coralliilyticus TaxID=190893 RepID=A0AAN0W035_9VIBR|nr:MULTISPECIES: hypothetical protein [Vibrio]AIW22295.1 hypothetical protein IX92_24815 [Vibrio coralliilyticus]MCZ2798956.1 hypothetical protein [Vibrio alginolyticus]NOH36850.1 hypothetical protein [Vibrio coralliilyticus]